MPIVCSYEPLLRLSPESYVAALEAKGEDLALAALETTEELALTGSCACACKDVFTLHGRLALLIMSGRPSQELTALYDALPSGMAIGGLVYVNTQKVRRNLCTGSSGCSVHEQNVSTEG
eukprot:scaffold277684_cov15-Tisochrysis_lutea.AAC.1